jgi:hypothetical protein
VVERVENDDQSSSETSVEINKGKKRSLDEPLDEEDIPVLERINKRVRFAEKENNEQLTEISNNPNRQLSNGKTKTDEQLSNEIPKKRIIKLTSAKKSKKRFLPSTRTDKQSLATWVRKYNIEDCYVQLNQYDPGKD